VRRPVQYVQHVTRIGHVARTYWLDLLVVVLALGAVLELAVRQDAPSAPRTTLWFVIPAIAILALPVLARRRHPFGAAAAAMQEMSPHPMRGQAAAIFLFVINLVGLGLGPQILPWVTDYVFRDEMQIHLSLLTVTTTAEVGAFALLLLALPRFRRAIRYRDRWMDERSKPRRNLL